MLREKYIQDAKNLKPLWDPVNPSNPSNVAGATKRYELKTRVRSFSIAGADKLLDVMEGPVENVGPLKPDGSVRRFWYTRRSANLVGRISTTGGFIGMASSAIRIASADDKVKETKKVASGLAGGWVAAKLAAPFAASVGLKVTAIAGPIAGLATAFAIEAFAGIAGSFGGEFIFDWLDRK